MPMLHQRDVPWMRMRCALVKRGALLQRAVRCIKGGSARRPSKLAGRPGKRAGEAVCNFGMGLGCWSEGAAWAKVDYGGGAVVYTRGRATKRIRAGGAHAEGQRGARDKGTGGRERVQRVHGSNRATGQQILWWKGKGWQRPGGCSGGSSVPRSSDKGAEAAPASLRQAPWAPGCARLPAAPPCAPPPAAARCPGPG